MQHMKDVKKAGQTVTIIHVYHYYESGDTIGALLKF